MCMGQAKFRLISCAEIVLSEEARHGQLLRPGWVVTEDFHQWLPRLDRSRVFDSSPGSKIKTLSCNEKEG